MWANKTQCNGVSKHTSQKADTEKIPDHRSPSSPLLPAEPLPSPAHNWLNFYGAKHVCVRKLASKHVNKLKTILVIY